MKTETYDLVAVGTGFATSFFLHRFLPRQRTNYRVLVLEAGQRVTHAEQLAKGNPRWMQSITERQFINKTPEKLWNFFTAFGGASNCWAACTPRLLPEDFRLRSTYGIGADWPIDYDELEPYYCDAEELMQVAGDSGDAPYPRSRPYPQPAHRLTEVDRALKSAFPDQYFCHPCARSPKPVPGQRPPCCNNGACQLCPVDAKFTILNGMPMPYADPRVTVLHGARVLTLDHNAGTVTAVHYQMENGIHRAASDLTVLGANAMFNPFIMLRSGMSHPELGRGLCEQVTRTAEIELDGLNNTRGTTVSTGLGYMCYSGAHRSRKAAALIQSDNRARMLNVRGRWLQSMRLNFIFEEFREPGNRVTVHASDEEKPEVTFARRSPRTDLGLAEMETDLRRILRSLPVKGIELGEPWKSDAHIMGTTVMGRDPATSVVDQDGLHHRYRNLVLLGSGLFPTAAPANPTLTLSALALRTADRLTAA